MKVSAVFKFRSPEIRALHLTWIAFFITFYVWFNMAPLASSMLKSVDWLTTDDLKLFAICRVFSVLMVTMSLPALAFAFGNSMTQLLVARLVLSSIGASFVVGIHMTALWFKPKDIGFAEGFYAGWGNYGVYYWFAITDGPDAQAHRKPRKTAAMEVSSWGDMIKLIIWTIPLVGVLAILVWRIQYMGYLSITGAVIAYLTIVAIVIYQIIQILRVNLPILRKGVPEDDKYSFNSVAALNSTYFANFGAEPHGRHGFRPHG